MFDNTAEQVLLEPAQAKPNEVHIALKIRLVPAFPLTLKLCVCEAIWELVKVVLPVEPEMFPVSSFGRLGFNNIN